MSSVLDVSAYILKKLKNNSCTHMKLHKLLYYSQAWSLVWDEKPLFKTKIEAWVNGPVVPEVYKKFRGLYTVSLKDITDINGDPSKLKTDQKETIDAVIKVYGDKTSHWLSELTHSEQPWQEARNGLLPNERGNNEISLRSMHEYYESL